MRPLVGVVIATILGAASGCSSDSSDPVRATTEDSRLDEGSYSPEPDVSNDDTENKEPPTSPRGFIPKGIGEEGGVYVEQGVLGYTFTVDEIIPNFQCDSTPEHGTFLAIRLTVNTTPDYEDMMFYISEQDFIVINEDGVQENSSTSIVASQCVPDSEEFPIGGPGPGVTLKAMFILDTAATSGIVALKPFGTTGWEWTF